MVPHPKGTCHVGFAVANCVVPPSGVPPAYRLAASEMVAGRIRCRPTRPWTKRKPYETLGNATFVAAG